MLKQKNHISLTKPEFQQQFSHHDISVWVDCYDDIFSDFDLRPYSDRNISDDFLSEVKKLSHESEFQINELRLLIPKGNRNPEIENTVTKRLHSHFVKNHHYFTTKKKVERKKDIVFAILGLFMMVCASTLSASKSQNILMHALLVVFEPAGWFLVWISMESLINNKRREKPELEFYNKVAKSKVGFFDA